MSTKAYVFFCFFLLFFFFEKLEKDQHILMKNSAISEVITVAIAVVCFLQTPMSVY